MAGTLQLYKVDHYVRHLRICGMFMLVWNNSFSSLKLVIMQIFNQSHLVLASSMLVLIF